MQSYKLHSIHAVSVSSRIFPLPFYWIDLTCILTLHRIKIDASNIVTEELQQFSEYLFIIR